MNGVLVREKILSALIIIAGIAVVTWILVSINRMIFRRIRKRRPLLHVRFIERIITAAIIIGCIILVLSVFSGVESVWKTLLGGTAIVSAVLVFAAQDVIKDVLAGLMISVYKPFEIGSRIELEDGTAGVVKDISMRHIVLKTWDAQMLIIPNSQMNEMKIRNNSYNTDIRSIQFHFYIAHDSDVEKAMDVIRDAIISSPYSIPGRETENGMDFGPVYFFAFEESSLNMATTVFFEPVVPSEVVKSDINVRVNKALAENGIEVPYRYVNVITKKEM